MENKKDDSNHYSRKDCLEKINDLKQFYVKNVDFYQDTKVEETDKWRFAFDACLKKKCPPGDYEIFGKCAPY
jgi:hypothetical protein